MRSKRKTISSKTRCINCEAAFRAGFRAAAKWTDNVSDDRPMNKAGELVLKVAWSDYNA